MLVIVPSRGRPENIRQLLTAWFGTRTYAELLVVVDDDDPEVEAYRDVMRNAPDWARLEVTERKRLGPTLNEYAVQNAPLYDVLGFMGDDHRPRTQGWDRRFAVAIAQEGGVGIAYGNDLIQGPNLPTAVWMSSCIVETVGYMVPKGIKHLFADDSWKSLGEAIRKLTYLSDVIIEHMHPVAGKSEWDDGYKECNAGSVWEGDESVYRAWVVGELQSDARKVIDQCVNQ